MQPPVVRTKLPSRGKTGHVKGTGIGLCIGDTGNLNFIAACIWNEGRMPLQVARQQRGSPIFMALSPRF